MITVDRHEAVGTATKQLTAGQLLIAKLEINTSVCLYGMKITNNNVLTSSQPRSEAYKGALQTDLGDASAKLTAARDAAVNELAAGSDYQTRLNEFCLNFQHVELIQGIFT